MNITFKPIQSFNKKITSIIKNGAVLIINDIEVNINELSDTRVINEDGSQKNKLTNDYIYSVDGEMVSILLPIGLHPTEAAKFPNDPEKNPNAPYENVPDGIINIPQYSTPRKMAEKEKLTRPTYSKVS